MRARLFRWFLPLLLVCFLTACGTQFFYNRLDTLIRWELDDYVELSDAQEDWLDKRFAEHWAWHRRDALPRYARWLKQLASEIDQPMTRAAIDGHYTQIEQFSDELLQRLLPDIEAFLAGLSDEQVQNLLQKLEEENEEFIEDYVEPSTEELLKKREKRVSKSLRNWAGSINEPQLALLKRWARDVHSLAADQLASNRIWQAEFKAALAYRTDKPRFSARLKTLLVEGKSLRTPAYAAKVERQVDAFRQLLVEESALLTTEQREHLKGELLDYVEDFEQLAAQLP